MAVSTVMMNWMMVFQPGNKNQQPFERIMIMEYDVHFIGRVKMTVGIRRRTHEKVQYCITAIQSL